MKINKDVISKLARLSKLKFNDDESKLISNDLSKMLKFINQLNDLETKDIDPLEKLNTWMIGYKNIYKILNKQDIVFFWRSEKILNTTF